MVHTQKLRLWDIKYFAQDLIASKCRNWDCNQGRLTLEPAPTLARSWYCADLLSRWTPVGWMSWRDCQTAGSLYAHQQRRAQHFSQRADVSCTPICILTCRVGKWWELQVDPQNNGFPSWSGWTRELIGWRRESRRPRAWITVRLKPFFFFSGIWSCSLLIHCWKAVKLWETGWDEGKEARIIGPNSHGSILLFGFGESPRGGPRTPGLTTG